MRHTAAWTLLWLLAAVIFAVVDYSQGLHWLAITVANVYNAAGFVISAQEKKN